MAETPSVLEEFMTAADERTIAKPNVAVLIPCYQEEKTIARVVQQFQEYLPDADIYVFDNNSSDRTVEEAVNAGAIVLHERRQGKGHVVRSMFGRVDADIYVMVDGDGTYPADVVERLIEPIRQGEADMVIGSRLHEGSDSEFRFLNRIGNHIFLVLLNSMFRVRLTDLLSGYRVFSRTLVRSLALFGGGFETETEMTIKALERGFSIVEVPVNLSRRHEESQSKIRIVHDSLMIVSTILTLFRDYRSLSFFGGLGLVLLGLSLVPGIWVFIDYYESGFVHRLPSAVLAVGLVVTASLSICVGLILHTISRRFRELEFQLRMLAEDLRPERKGKR